MEKDLLITFIYVLYFLLILGTIAVIITDTRNPVKSLGYILLVLFIPVIGIFVYFSIGINYRKRIFYRRKKREQQGFYAGIKEYVAEYSEMELQRNPKLYEDHRNVVQMLSKENLSPLFTATDTRLLINGEEKFPAILDAMEAAKDHIHIEYFIYNDDEIGNRLKDLMIKKAKDGVKVRFIFDDYGSHVVRKRMMKELQAAGVEVCPFYKIRIFALANSMNFRNHRKIIVVDGNIGFVGGINVDDRYINNGKNELFWRDTHLKIEGNAVIGLQYIFMNDWNLCRKQEEELTLDPRYFPIEKNKETKGTIQIAASGPDNLNADIMLSLLGIITTSERRLYITTPYFIPNETIVDALKYAALSGVDVRLLVPGISDSVFVNAASCSYYEELLQCGIRIYRYQKGFVHAKTIVSDEALSVVGTANMDIRSFDLMFEVNALVYNKEFNQQLTDAFFKDLEDSTELQLEEWEDRSRWKKFCENCARLLSPLL